MNESFEASTTPCSSVHGVECRAAAMSGMTSRSRGGSMVDKLLRGTAETEADDMDSVGGMSSLACSRCSYVTGCDVSDSVSNVYAATAPQPVSKSSS